MTPARPLKIDVHPEGFYIDWNDGHSSVFPSHYLRFMCHCAACVSEWTGERTITEADVDRDIHAIGVDAVGNYAVQITWSDRHDTGIYPFERLRAMCPCDACRESRTASN